MIDLESIPSEELIREMLRVNEAYIWSPLAVRREVARRLAAAEAEVKRWQDWHRADCKAEDEATPKGD